MAKEPPAAGTDHAAPRVLDPDELQALLSARIATLEGKDEAEVLEEREREQREKLVAAKRADLERELARSAEPGWDRQALLECLAAQMEEAAGSQLTAARCKRAAAKSERQRTETEERARKAEAARERLAGLSRELQRRNKLLSEQLQAAHREQRQAHEELKKKFDDALVDIGAQIERTEDARAQHAKENESLRQTIAQLQELHRVQEEHFSTQLKTKTLEGQLAEARLKQQQEFARQEAGKAKVLRARLEAAEAGRAEAEAKAEKFVEDKVGAAHQTIAQYQEILGEYKAEMTRVAARTEEREKAFAALERRQKETDLQLIQLFEQRGEDRKALEKATRQKDQLEQLCRVLERERTALKEVSAAQRRVIRGLEAANGGGGGGGGGDDGAGDGAELAAGTSEAVATDAE